MMAKKRNSKQQSQHQHNRNAAENAPEQLDKKLGGPNRPST
ncbi:spore protein [Sutcliffiella sp. NPDC057660]